MRAEEEHTAHTQSVKGSSESVHTGSKGEVGIREGTANQVGGVGADVTSLVVSVDGEIEPQQL